jgi:DNA polymerase-3 subunit delta
MTGETPKESTPTMVLLNGDDEFAIAQYLAKTQAGLGDASLVVMNLAKLDGRTYNLDDLLSIAGAMPFLARRRLVILEYPTARLSSKEAQERFIAQLGKIPPSTLLILVEYKILTDRRAREKNKLHWLEEWAFSAGEKVWIKRFELPKMEELPRWIQDKAKAYGGQFTRAAAGELAGLVGDEPRLADQEIQKLLTYVNYRRPVELDDVHLLTADMREGDIFTLVDAIGNRNVRGAMAMLQRLLEEDEPIAIFAMIVRQFRLLLQVRELLDQGSNPAEIACEIHLHPYVAGKISGQAHRFSLPVLERIYHRLAEIDEEMKTSQVPGNLALETLVVQLGNIDPVHADPEVVW